MPTIKVNKRGSRLFRQNDDGTETELPVPRHVRAMTDEEIRAAALSDPDNPPTQRGAELGRKRRPRSFVIRRALKLTQEEFARRYGIDLDMLRRWEAGELEPDSAATSLLKLIAHDPVETAAILSPSQKPEAAE